MTSGFFKLRILFSMAALLHGLTIAAATVAWKHPLFAVFHAENATAVTFLISVVFFIPFVLTYTNLGLNSAEGKPPSPETQRRLDLLTRHCKAWPATWYGPVGFVAISWGLFFILGDSVHPFFAFAAAMSLVSGCWFLFVYPTARSLFSDQREESTLNPPKAE